MQVRNVNSIEFYGRRRNPKYMDSISPNVEPINFDNQITELSNRSRKLFKALEDQINNDWGDIKKGKSVKSSPKYEYTDKIGNLITIKPIYGGLRPQISLKILNDENVEHFMFDRSNPNNFKYEKIVETDYGFATLKTFNSEVEHDTFMITRADDLILRYFPKVISSEIKHEYFAPKKHTCKIIKING